jgi:hypothetical protein
MSHQSWQETLVAAQADGTAVTATSEGSLLPGQAKYTIPANYLDYIGKKLRIRAAGRISNIVTTPGTLTLKVKMGPTSTIIAAASSAMQLNAVAKTNVTWVLDWAFDLRSIGSGTSATWMHTGTWQSESVVGSPLPSAGGAGQFMIPASAPAVGTGFDSTVANLLDLTAQFSLTGNSIQLHQFALEAMN